MRWLVVLGMACRFCASPFNTASRTKGFGPRAHASNDGIGTVASESLGLASSPKASSPRGLDVWARLGGGSAPLCGTTAAFARRRFGGVAG